MLPLSCARARTELSETAQTDLSAAHRLKEQKRSSTEIAHAVLPLYPVEKYFAYKYVILRGNIGCKVRVLVLIGTSSFMDSSFVL